MRFGQVDDDDDEDFEPETPTKTGSHSRTGSGSGRRGPPRRASALSATGGVSKHKATAPDAASDDDEEEEGGEGGTSTLREWLYKNFLHPYPVRAPPSVSQFSLHT